MLKTCVLSWLLEVLHVFRLKSSMNDIFKIALNSQLKVLNADLNKWVHVCHLFWKMHVSSETVYKQTGLSGLSLKIFWLIPRVILKY